MKTKNNTEKAQAVFLLKGVGVFLKTPDLDQMTVQNGFGAISVSRTPPQKKATHILGFAAETDETTAKDEFDENEFRKSWNDDEDEFDEDEYNNSINDLVRWFE